jgi:hypothetical protein
MKKKILGITLAMGAFLLASCGANDSKRDTYVEVLNQCNEKLQEHSDTKLASSISMDNFTLKTDSGDITSTRTFVYFMSLLYKNPNFIITEDAVSIDADYVDEGLCLQDNEMTILGKMEEESGLVNFELYGSCATMYSEPRYFYFIFEIHFDFANNILNDFDMYLYEVKNGDLDKNYPYVNRYLDGNLYYGLTDEEHSLVFYEYANTNYWSKHKDNLMNAEKIGNFSYEYTKATNDILGEDYFG